MIIKFEGCYYGYVDLFLVKVGSGVITFGLSDSSGVSAAATATTLCVMYNNFDEVKVLFVVNLGKIVGVIFEFVVGNSGFIVLDKEFL